MKVGEFSAMDDVISLWREAVDAEFDRDIHRELASRLVPVIAEVARSVSELPAGLFQIGFETGSAGVELGFAFRVVQLLAKVCPQAAAVGLRTLAAATNLADGWNAAVVEQVRPATAILTPLPIVVGMIRERLQLGLGLMFSRSAGVAVVVIDLHDLVLGTAALHELQAAVARHVRGVFTSGEPLTAGPNGNMLVLVARDGRLAELAARLSEHVRADPLLRAYPVRVWIEPIAPALFHLGSHIESLVGTTVGTTVGTVVSRQA
ncbi:MAG TPA: hypothetical protein VGM78_03485 [Ilumatobacteraceae bacterium]